MFGCCIAAAAVAQDIPEPEWARLAAGDVVLLDARDLGGGGAARARALVWAEAEEGGGGWL